jgi:hypothetical protein
MKKTTNNTMQIQSTSDYGLFKPHGEQQPMQPAHVKRIITSMKRNGFITAKPIHAYRDGKFLRIIDGHHRLRAAQTLGIPVYYVVGEKSEMHLIADENYAVRKWSGESFIHMYASRGKQDYITLVSYVKRGIPIVFATSLLAGESAQSGNQNESIRAGTFRVKTTEYADQVLHIMDALGSINPEARSRTFIAAISALLRLPEFSPSVLISKIEQNPRMLVKCANREQMLDLLEEIYNFRAREKSNLAFAATNMLASRRKGFGK